MVNVPDKCLLVIVGEADPWITIVPTNYYPVTIHCIVIIHIIIYVIYATCSIRTQI